MNHILRVMATRARAGKDYDRILGLRPEAAVEEIPKARRLALERHQDRNPRDLHAEERFKEIGEAYAVLIDPAKRRSARHS